MASRPVYASDGAIVTHLRNVKLHQGVTYESLSEAASTEVDGKLGIRYVTPFVLDPTDPIERPTALWLQNVTSMIAAGRYLLSVSAPGSQEQLNNYGHYLVKTACEMIDLVLTGKLDLGGVPEVDNTDPQKIIQGATIINQDRYSQVDVFYDNHFPDGFMPDREPRQIGVTWPR